MKNNKSLLIPATISAIVLTLAPFSNAQVPSSGYDSEQQPIDGMRTDSTESHVDVSYDASADVDSLRQASFESRATVIQSVESNVNAAAAALYQIQTPGIVGSSDLKESLEAATSARVEVNARLSELGESDADGFEEARSALIESLNAFAEATTSLNTALEQR